MQELPAPNGPNEGRETMTKRYFVMPEEVLAEAIGQLRASGTGNTPFERREGLLNALGALQVIPPEMVNEGAPAPDDKPNGKGNGKGKQPEA